MEINNGETPLNVLLEFATEDELIKLEQGNRKLSDKNSKSNIVAIQRSIQ